MRLGLLGQYFAALTCSGLLSEHKTKRERGILMIIKIMVYLGVSVVSVCMSVRGRTSLVSMEVDTQCRYGRILRYSVPVGIAKYY